MPLLSVTAGAARDPVARINCVGRKQAACAAGMGKVVDRIAPLHVTRSPFPVARSGETMPYLPVTEDYHEEVKFVIAIDAPASRLTATSDRRQHSLI